MRKQLLLLFAAAFMVFSITGNAQYLDADFFGFEEAAEPADGWYWNASLNDNISMSSEQAFSGSYSLKYEFADYEAFGTGTNAQCESTVSEGAKFTGTAGTYKIRIRVFVVSNPPSIFKTIIGTPWKQINWDLTTVETGKWVTMMQEFTLAEDVVDSKIVCNVYKTTFEGMTGSGSFYIDDIEIFDPVNFDDQWPELKETYFSFESGSRSWWVPNTYQRDYIEEVFENSATGFYSMKFSCNDYTELAGKDVSFSSSAPDGSLNIATEGPYHFELKVYIPSGSIVPSSFMTNVKSSGGVNYKTVAWNLAEVTERDTWVTLDQIQELTGVGSTVIAGKIPKNNMPASGAGSFFIDDIKVYRTYASATKKHDNITPAVYPNPASEYITIKAKAGSLITIFDLTGKSVAKSVQMHTINPVDVSNLNSGMYIVKINTNGVVSTQKILIK